jgi:hypothetical protein
MSRRGCSVHSSDRMIVGAFPGSGERDLRCCATGFFDSCCAAAHLPLVLPHDPKVPVCRCSTVPKQCTRDVVFPHHTLPSTTLQSVTSLKVHCPVSTTPQATWCRHTHKRLTLSRARTTQHALLPLSAIPCCLDQEKRTWRTLGDFEQLQPAIWDSIKTPPRDMTTTSHQRTGQRQLEFFAKLNNDEVPIHTAEHKHMLWRAITTGLRTFPHNQTKHRGIIAQPTIH